MKYFPLTIHSLLHCVLILFNLQLFAQTTTTTGTIIDNQNLPHALKDVHINLYIRSSFELPLSDKLNKDNLLSAFRLNEGRFEVRGTVWKGLNFRMRTRFSTTRPQFKLSNSNNNIDYALVGYKFGNGKKKPFEIEVGKQNNMLGSWEFWNNPTYEYRYSSIGGGRAINIFPVGARISYSPNENHIFTLQTFNTYSNGFNTNILNAENFKPVRVPVTILLAWNGQLFDNRLQTWYSIAMKNYAHNRPNYQIAIGNQLDFEKFNLYLDIISTYTGFEYTKLLEKTYTTYHNLFNHGDNLPIIARDFVYSSAILRFDYEFSPYFFLIAKAWYERADSFKDTKLGLAFYNNVSFLTGLEYKPVKTQDMRIFAYYYNDRTFYNNLMPKNVLSATMNQGIAIGVLYFVNVL